MQYRVRWFDAQARAVREQTTEAASEEAALQQLGVAGAVVLSMSALRQAPANRSRREFDVAWWCRELRMLLSAGMTVVEALETLHAQPLGEARARVHAGLVAQLQQGRSLSAAMQSAGVFPDVLVAGVKGSERTGALVTALDDFLRYEEMLERLRRQVVSAAIYPAVVVVLGGVIVLFLLLFVIPRFSQMYADVHGDISLATRVLLGLSRLLAEHGVLVATGLASLAVGAVALWRSGAVTRAAVALEASWPALRQRIDEFRLAKLYQALAVMFRGGYALDEALGHCAALGLGERLAASVQQARTALARGERLSTAWAAAGLADPVAQRLLAVGERTGSFDRVLSTIAERHAGNFTTFVERATRLVEPALLLLVALVVGGIVVAMYMPVFDIASSVR